MTSERRHFAFLPLIKPPGPTSHDMVDLVRRLLPRKTKVGHTGTLDPFASGVMILAIGKATKFADEIHKLPKRYVADVHLGSRTDTLDPTGQVDAEADVPAFDETMLKELAQRFTGTQDQVPPVFSAKRVGGRKSYELARQQQKVELKPAEITIFDLTLTKKDDHTVSLDALCSTGTYIRALARDLAEALGTCGYVTELRRTAVGNVTHDDCIEADALTADNLAEATVSVSSLLAKFPEVDLPLSALTYLSQGRPFPTREQLPATFLGSISDQSGDVQAIFRCEYDPILRAVHSRQLCYRRPDNLVKTT